MATYLTTTEAARELGVSRSRVLHLIHDGTGRLKAERFGKSWKIALGALRAVRHREKCIHLNIAGQSRAAATVQPDAGAGRCAGSGRD